MSPVKAPPQIFNRHLVKIRRARAARRADSFLALRCANDASGRLCDVNRRFKNALIIGSPEFYREFISGLPKGKRPENLTRFYTGETTEGLEQSAEDDALPFAAESFDLIISALSLHTVNDLPGALMASRSLLKPDGLFIGAMFGGETLQELRRAAYAADENTLSGLTPRVLPFADYSQAAALLQRSGLALPVVDTDRVTVRYKDLQTLFSDIRDMGDMNCLLGRDMRPLGKPWRQALFKTYQDIFCENERFIATFEILWMTGWAPHESQQKPLKPGSAKMRLADALGTTETPVR